MRIINKPRQAGKTRALLEAMQADDRLIYVTSSEQAAGAAWKAAQALPGIPLARDRFRGLQSALNEPGGKDARTQLVIDEFEDVLAALFHADIVAVTVSAEEQE